MHETEPGCVGGIAPDGTKVCILHDVAATNREVAELRGFTEGMPDFGLAWFCPVSGSALGGFDDDQTWQTGLGAL